jgi:hypothetical protein
MITLRASSFVAVVAAVHFALVPGLAFATGASPGSATPMQREQAQSKFAKGKELFGQKKYSEALAEFKGSLDIVASPNARLYVARCYREMGNLVAAYTEFGRTEVEAKELAPQDPRYIKTGEAAQAERKEIEPKLAFVTVTVQNATDSTKLTVGGEEVRRAGWTEPAPLMPGGSDVIVETPGHEPVKKQVTLNAGEKTALTIDAASGTVTTGPVGPSDGGGDKKPETSSEGRDYRTYAYIAGGVGAAGLLTFGIFGAMAASRWSTVKSECGAGPCPESKRDLVEGGQTYQTVANIGLAIGIVGVATGVTLFVISKPKKPTEGTTTAVVGPSFVGITGSF